MGTVARVLDVGILLRIVVRVLSIRILLEIVARVLGIGTLLEIVAQVWSLSRPRLLHAWGHSRTGIGVGT